MKDVNDMLTEAKTIAVVGLSSKEHRESNSVARYLQDAGYRIIPVNPKEEEVLGEKAYPSLVDVPGDVDIVDVFRRSEETPQVAKDAVEKGAKVLWLQLGIANDEAKEIAEQGGLDVVMDTCIRTHHRMLEV